MVPEARPAGTTTRDILEETKEEIRVKDGTAEKKMESGGFACIRGSSTIEATS